LAIAYAPSFVTENSGGIATNWPRIPLPASLDVLLGSAEHGKLLAEVLDPLRPIQTGLLIPSVGSARRVNGGAIRPELGHLEVRAGWGHVQKDGAVMPARGKLTSRAFTEAELAALSGSQGSWGKALDIYLNDGTYWSGVPEPVWEFKIGGFQVLKKWLSYREFGTEQSGPLGRSLTSDEARTFSDLARRLAAVVARRTELDANYVAVKADTWAWQNT